MKDNRERKDAIGSDRGSATLTESGRDASTAPAWPLQHKERRPINNSAPWEEVCVRVVAGGWVSAGVCACGRVCCVCACAWRCEKKVE